MDIVKGLTEIGAQAILRGFNVEDAGKDFHVWCKRCSKGWALKKTSTHVGNVLHLLNHEKGHRQPNEERTSRIKKRLKSSGLY